MVTCDHVANEIESLLSMREWLSGRASPCQGESRGFDPRLPLPFFIQAATSPSGKARLCKSCTSGSNPLVASLRNVIDQSRFFLLYQDATHYATATQLFC
jgi:hypothetical protein